MDDLIPGDRRAGEALRRVGVLLGYGVVGAVVTAVVGFGLLPLMNPVQPMVYDLFYLRVGPSGATEVAILAHFMIGAVVALGIAMLAGDVLSDRGANLRLLGMGFAVLLALILPFLVIALAGLAAFLTALIVLAVGFVGIPVALRFGAGVRSGAVPAFVGGIPIIVLLLLLAGFGLGWGWGYVMTGEEVPGSAVDGSVADFDDALAVRDALLVDGDCSPGTDGRRTCHLYLRGSDHEAEAARFMARHGVRCPYQNDGGRSGSFIAEAGGTFYRVTCSPHGD